MITVKEIHSVTFHAILELVEEPIVIESAHVITWRGPRKVKMLEVASA